MNEQDLSILHVNISSLSAHKDNLRTFLKITKIESDVICISESRLSSKYSITTNIEIAGYNIEQTPTESTAGRALKYFSQNISYKPYRNLQIYFPEEIESIFFEVLIPNKQNYLTGTVYKHLSMRHFKFNDDYITPLLNKLKTENKATTIILT